MKPAALLLATLTLACDGPAPTAPTTPTPVPATPSPPVQPQLSAATTNTVGRATADVLLRSQDVATFRVDAGRFEPGATGPDRFAGYTILRPGRALTPAESHQLATLLLNDASYNAVDKAKCPHDEAYGVRATHGAEVVELLITFPCNRVSFLRRASGDSLKIPGEYIDPVADTLAALLRSAAP